jgi:hypothetical protein
MPRFMTRRMLAAVVAFALILTRIKHVLIDNRPRDVFFATLSGLFGHTTICAKAHRERGRTPCMRSRQAPTTWNEPRRSGQGLRALFQSLTLRK